MDLWNCVIFFTFFSVRFQNHTAKTIESYVWFGNFSGIFSFFVVDCCCCPLWPISPPEKAFWSRKRKPWSCLLLSKGFFSNDSYAWSSFNNFFIDNFFLFAQFPFEMNNEDRCVALMKKHQISPNAPSSNLQRSHITPFLVTVKLMY